MRAALLLATLAACASPGACPVAAEVYPISLDDQPLDSSIDDGIRSWAPLGFEITDVPGDECPDRWMDAPGCTLTIGFHRINGQTQSFRDQRLVEIDARDTGSDLADAAAHEVGHIVLNTSQHTATGVMAGHAHVLTQDDYDLACSSVGICDCGGVS